MIAPNDDGGAHFPLTHQFVELQPGFVALTEPQPADARWQTLECHALLGHRDPAVQRFIMGEELENRLVRSCNIRRIAGKGHPTKRSTPDAELRANIGGHKSRKRERVLESVIKRTLTDVVSIVERLCASPPEFDHQLHVPRYRIGGSANILIGIAKPQSVSVLARQPLRVVAVEWVMRGGLIGQHIWDYTFLV